jgi:hypothetical protein
MTPTTPMLAVLIFVAAYMCHQLVQARKQLSILDRKFNALLAGLGLDPQKTDFAAESIARIAELYRAGKQDEAKQLAKETLTSPAEFKKAWQACEDKSTSK